MVINVEDNLIYLQDALTSLDFIFWQEAINDEMVSPISNGTWKLVELPLAKGFSQIKDLDFFDTYSLVTRITSIRLLIVVAINNLFTCQMDVRITFLNGNLDKEIYM